MKKKALHGKDQDRIVARRLRKDRLVLGGTIFLTLLTVSPIILIIYKLVEKGYRQLSFEFLVHTTPSTFDAMMAVGSGERIPGGIANGVVGTLVMVLMASILAIPLGVITGIFLYENPGKRLSGFVRDTSDILQGVPSIVLGLISYMWVVRHITGGYSALAGSVSLSIMMLPMIVRSTEETLKMIPVTIKEAGMALGTPYHKVILRVLIPTGFGGLFTGILLGLSRILGETAPLMLTALGSSIINLDITKPTSAVPLLIWEFYNDPNMVDLIWSSSLLLMIIILLLNFTAKRIASRRKATI